MKKIAAAMAVVGTVALSASAYAMPITGSSRATLTKSTEGTVTATQVNPYEVSWKVQNNLITHLTAGQGNGQNAISQDYATLGGTGVKLASLTWANGDNASGSVLNLVWQVAVNITEPNHTGALPVNTLDVNLINGGSADTVQLDSISSLAWNFATATDNWVVNNFRYVKEGTGTLDAAGWHTAKGETGTLWIEADFKDTPIQPPMPPVPPTAPVPEPGTMVLLGAGFAGLAIFRKRRANR